MNYSLKQIRQALDALRALGGDKEPILKKLDQATEILKEALKELDEIEVAGRGAVDCLLGCMMAIEKIVGKEDADG